MNASEQATNLELASKIATAVNLFKSEFPDASVDLKPWINTPDTQELVDPDSIDLGFHFPGISRRFRSRSILVQIRFSGDGELRRAIGVDLAGFDHRGNQWKLSTVAHWQFEGSTEPMPDIQTKLKHFCQQLLDVFNRSTH